MNIIDKNYIYYYVHMPDSFLVLGIFRGISRDKIFGNLHINSSITTNIEVLHNDIIYYLKTHLSVWKLD